MTILHEQIQMLRAELTSYGISRRERTQIERELRLAEAKFEAKRRAFDAHEPPA